MNFPKHMEVVMANKKILTAVLSAAVFTSSCGLSEEKIAQAVSGAVSTSPERQIIVIDAGHGGADGGGVSVNGVPEKGMNLDISLTLSDMLNLMGYETVLTRTEDISIHDDDVTGLKNQKLSDMKNRLELFNTEGAVCISIHQNRYTDSVYSGAQMFYYSENADGARLAECLRSRICGYLQPDNKRETKPVDDELYLLYNCKNPAVMAECGFISNPEESAKLETAEYRSQVAFSLMCGLNDFIR
jgi:N-acetylmuramoyl-L-alanine amidase